MTDSAWQRALSRIQSLLPLAGVVVAVFYAVLRLFYVQFYARFGISPEEAGLGKVELLTQALVGPLVFAIVFGVFMAGFFMLYAILFSRWYVPFFKEVRDGVVRARRARGVGKKLLALLGSTQKKPKETFKQWFRRLSREMRRLYRRIRVALVAVALVFGLAASGSELLQAGHHADRLLATGEAVHPQTLSFGSFELPMLAVRAEPVTLLWTNEQAAEAFRPLPEHCLVYLGQDAGTTVVYDVLSRRNIKFPAAQAITTVSTNRDLPPSCTPARA